METWVGKPKRLERVFSNYREPIYFVTCVTAGRRALLANQAAQQALMTYAHKNVPHGRCMGRYVLMPDHLHFVVRLHAEARLTDYVRLLKQAITQALRSDVRDEGEAHVWQPGFFDRLVRGAETYGQVWAYVRDNAPEAGLAEVSEQWPYQGEIEPLRF